MTAVLECTRCRAPLGDSFLSQGGSKPCPACSVPLEVEVFPALFRPIARGADGEPILVEGEASCFYHPVKKASVPCQGCGRFLCALCNCELNGQHFCPVCLETGKQKGKIKNLQNQRTLYGNIALALAVYPVVIIFGIYFTFITAPLALYIAIWHWKKPGSIVGGGHVRHVLAILLAIAQLVGWGVIIYFIATEASRHHG